MNTNFLVKLRINSAIFYSPIICFYLLLFGCSNSSESSSGDTPQNNNGITDATLFAAPPDSLPKKFAKDIISMPDRYEYGLSISPDYKELFFTIESPGEGLIRLKKGDDGKWSYANHNLAVNGGFAMEAFFSNDGNKLFYSMISAGGQCQIWTSDKTASGWATPVKLNSPINNNNVFFSTLSKKNTIYFTNISEMKIYRSALVNGSYSSVESTPLPMGAVHPFISPNEDFILFDYNYDIYVAFIGTNGSWGNPIKLNSNINTSYDESCPSLSPDGKYLFFSRYNDTSMKSDIYWAGSSVIDKLKK